MAAWMTPDIRRVVAQNPSPMTGRGTNTYIIGHGDVAVIDPGPDLATHAAAIAAALQSGERISHIFVTHTHLDHSALAHPLAATTGAVVLGFGAFDAGRSAIMCRLAAEGLRDGGEGIDRHFRPDVALRDGDVVSAPSWALRALHTPGHASNHLCFAAADHLFSGDHVMGWSSSLISPPDGDMAAYMASLGRLRETAWTTAFPGHGDVIADPDGRIAALIAHRQLRASALQAALADGPQTISAMTARLYHDIPAALHPAASRNILAHAIDLREQKIVTCEDVKAPDPTLRLA
jgi:glyoxylase-like metal-dependent hydrolase (beta-lactamase superfamily II)